jgi:hypothetical protein
MLITGARRVIFADSAELNGVRNFWKLNEELFEGDAVAEDGRRSNSSPDKEARDFMIRLQCQEQWGYVYSFAF